MAFPLMGLIGALTGVGANLGSGKLQANAARDAARLQDRYLRDALAYAKQQDALDRAQYGEERSRLWRREDDDRGRAWGREDARDARLAPFRGYGTGQPSNSLASLLTGPPQRPSMGLPGGTNGSTRRLADLVRA